VTKVEKSMNKKKEKYFKLKSVPFSIVEVVLQQYLF